MSERTSWLSFLVPAYNVERYLPQCLDSIAAQMQPGIEVVVLDDASTDGTLSLIEAARARFGGALRVIHHERNHGIAAVRNRLLQEAGGRYLWFVDGDDELCAGAVQALADIVENERPDLVLCDFRVLRQRFGWKHRLRGERHRRTFHGPERQADANLSTLTAGLLTHGQLHCWSKIARREIWQGVVFPEGHYFEDLAITAQLIGPVRSYRHVSEPWLAYRQHSESILATYTPAKMRDLASALQALRAGLSVVDQPLDEAATFALDQFCLKTYASLARRLTRADSPVDQSLEDALKASFLGLFPNGIDPILRGYLRRGWLLRAQRVRGSLRRAGFA